MSKFTGWLYKIISGIYGLLLLVILGVCLFAYQTDYSYRKLFQLPNWLYALLGAVCILMFVLLGQAAGRLLKKVRHPNRVMMVLSVLFGGFLILLSYHYYFKTGWDAQMVEGAARAVANNDWESVQNKYFSYYPNNVFLVFLFSLPIRLGKLAGIGNYYFCIIMFQCVLFAWTGYLLYRCGEMLKNVSCGIAIWLLFVALVGLSPWVVVPYSDAAGLIFPTAQVYLYLRICRKERPQLYTFLLAFLCFVGFKIKPQIAIVGIAVLILTLLKLLERGRAELKTAGKRLGVAVLGLMLAVCVVKLGTASTHLEIDEELTFGLPHFFMMGLNEEYNGVINIEDQNFSMSFQSAKERNEANIEVALERIKTQGFGGLLKLGKKKLLTNFSDGTFAWWEEGEFYTEEMYDGNYQLRMLLTDYYYQDREHFEVFKSVMQTLWLGCLLMAVAVLLVKEKNREMSLLKLSVIGITLFELIFEARARYLFIYAPLFIVLAVLGVYRGIEELRNRG